MREVSACDFCGEEAAGTFEAVPPERDPAGEGRRLVLCPDCRDTLGTVLEPLLEPGRSADPGAAPAGETGTTTVVAEPEREPEAGADPGDRGGSASESEAGTASGRDRSPGTDGTSPAGDASDANAGGERTVEASEPGREVDVGEAIGSDASVEEEGGRPGTTRRGAPRGYRKVMRFLENREFPVDREEAEGLAAEAYGMDRETVSAAVDHAIKHNRLREVSGDLLQ